MTADRSTVSCRLPAVLTDFDDTAAAQNVAELLLNEFGDPTWTSVRDRFRAGELSLKDYQEITFLRMRADRYTMQAYVREHANFRPHFNELVEYCQERNIPLCIVSQGLDFYIQALLDGSGQPKVPVYAVAAQFDERGSITGYRYDFPYPEAPELGNSKALIVQRFRDAGRHVYYMATAAPILKPAKLQIRYSPIGRWRRCAMKRALHSPRSPTSARCWRRSGIMTVNRGSLAVPL